MRLIECSRQRLHRAAMRAGGAGIFNVARFGRNAPGVPRTLRGADPWSVAEEVKPSTISTAQLHWLPSFHMPPIKQVISLWSYPVDPVGNLISRRASHLDAFSAYPDRT